MECPYCKEEIKQAAVKCRNCGEFLRLTVRLVPLLRTLVQVVVPVLSLSLAYVEFGRANRESQRRAVAETAEAVAKAETQQTRAILEQMPRGVLLEKARSEIEPQILREIERGNFTGAEAELETRLKANPEDDSARRGLIYSRTLRKTE